MKSDRRQFIRTGLVGCLCCLASTRFAAAGADAAAGGHAHWEYDGATGPTHWGELQPDFKTCQIGLEQTPIDLVDAIPGDPGRAEINYAPLPLRIVNNGHTIQVNAAPGGYCKIHGERYDLAQFHFHHPSEHLLAGKPLDLECHFVHKSAAGALAVIGVFIKKGKHNKALAPLFDAMPTAEGPEIQASGTVDPRAILPERRDYFRYLGSLTTPPCSEGVTWTLFKQPIEASAEQIGKFAALYANNARPVQPTHRRFLIEGK